MRKSFWRVFEGKSALDVGVAVGPAFGRERTIGIVGTDHRVYVWNGEEWEDLNFAGDGVPSRISGGPNGEFWVVAEGKVWWLERGSSWFQIHMEQHAVDVAADLSGGFWVSFDDSEVAYHSGHRHPKGPKLVRDHRIYRAPFHASAIAADIGGKAWAVNSDGRLRSIAIQQEPPLLNVEAGRVGAAVADVGIGADGTVWIVASNQVYAWIGTRWRTPLDFTDLREGLGKGLQRIAVAADGTPVVVDEEGNVWQLRWTGQDDVQTKVSDLTLTVEHPNEAAGTLQVTMGSATTILNDNVRDVFHYVASANFTCHDGTESLLALAAKVGGHHVTFYQVILVDDPGFPAGKPAAGYGMTPRAPYIDPPRGGFLGDSTEKAFWSDNVPWYFDEYLPAGTDDDHLTWMTNTLPDQRTINFNDDPHFDSGAPAGSSMIFRTWVVIVDEDAKPVFFLGGFGWKSIKNALGGRTPVFAGFLPLAYPSVTDYEALIYRRVPKRVPPWFDRSTD